MQRPPEGALPRTINQGRTLYEVQHLLGHTQVKTTQRDAHLSQDTLRSAANAATRALDGYMVLPATQLTGVPLLQSGVGC